MISRCQSDLILSNRFIATHYKRVDKNIEKCKALLRGIQKEFKKTRDFWDQLKNPVQQKSLLNYQEQNFNSQNTNGFLSSDVSSKTTWSTKATNGSSNNTDEQTKKAGRTKNEDEMTKHINDSTKTAQDENIQFSKISKLDVKHLEAFLDIVQKTQVSKNKNGNDDFNSMYDSSDLEIFEDALCQLSSVTSLNFDQSHTSSSTDISFNVYNFHFAGKTVKVRKDEREDFINMPPSNLQRIENENLPASLGVCADKFSSSKHGQNFAYSGNNFPENFEMLQGKEGLDNSRIIYPYDFGFRDIGKSKSESFKNENDGRTFDESDSDEYQEACDNYNSEEHKFYPFFSQISDSKSEQGYVKAENGCNETDKIEGEKYKTPGAYIKFPNTCNRNDRVVKFSAFDRSIKQNDQSMSMFKQSVSELERGELDHSRKNILPAGKEHRSRPRIRITKQRKLIKVKRKDRSRTRSRSRKKSCHDMATGTSDLELSEYFYQWPQRLLKQRDPFYSLPAKRRHFDYSTEEPSGIFHPSLLQPFNGQYGIERHGQNELIVKKHMSLNSLYKKSLSNNEFSDNGSNTTFSIKRSSSSDQGTFMKNYPSEDRFSIHNSTILNNSSTNIFVFRSFEDRFKQLNTPDTDKESFEKNMKKHFELHNYSGSESSRGKTSSTERKLRKKKYSCSGRAKQPASNDEKCNLTKEMEQKDFSAETHNIPKEEHIVSKINAVIPCVGHIHSDHIEIPQCTQLLNETKILYSRLKLRNSLENSNNDQFKSSDGATRKQRRLSGGESDLIERKNVDIILNNRTKLSDIEKRKASSREGSVRRPGSSSSKKDDKEFSVERSMKEECKLQLVNGKGDIYVSEVYQKTPHSSLTSLNRDNTGSKISKTPTKTVLEPRVMFKISASSDDVRTEKINSNENLLTTINLTKSTSSFSGIESEISSKMKMKKLGRKYMSCNDLSDDNLYSKINIIPLTGDDKGLIQQVSIVGQRLWVQGATISASFKNNLAGQEEVNKPTDTCKKASTGLDNNRPPSSSKKSVVDESSENSDKTSKNNENKNVSREVIKNKPVRPPKKAINSKKTETPEIKPLFCPYVNKNYSSNRNVKPKVSKPINQNRSSGRIQSPPKPMRPKLEQVCKIFEEDNENKDKSLNMGPTVEDCSDSDDPKNIKIFNDIVSDPDFDMFCDQAMAASEGEICRGIESDIDEVTLREGTEFRNAINEAKESGTLNKKKSNDKHFRKQTDNSSGSTKNTSSSKSSSNKNVTDSKNSSDATLMSSQQNLALKDQKPSKPLKKKNRSPSKGRRNSSSEENNDKLEELQRTRQELCSILPNNSLIKQIILNRLKSGNNFNLDDCMNVEEVDVFGAPLINSFGGPFYNEHGYPIANMSGVSLYNSHGIPTKGAYGRPLHTTLKKELAKIVEGSDERRNVFHRMNRHFEEQLLHALQTISNVRMDMYGRVYDSYGRPLFDRYGHLLYDHIGNPLTDAFGRKLTDKYGISIMTTRKKCANVMLTTLSSNESVSSSHQSSDERLVKNRTELNKKSINSRDDIWKKCKRQVSFNMDPTIITVNHSDSELETNMTNFKR